MSGGQFTVAARDALQAIWNAIITAYGPTGTDPDWQVGVFSLVIATGCRDDPNTVSRTPVVFASPSPTTAFQGITEAVTRQVAYTQRKRTIGVGQ
jgi:hypothetical protein